MEQLAATKICEQGLTQHKGGNFDCLFTPYSLRITPAALHSEGELYGRNDH